MKRKFPNYKKRNVIEEIKLPKKEQQTLDKFIGYCSINAKEKKLHIYRRILIQVYDVTQTSYDSWELETLRQFLIILSNSGKLNSTTNDVKKILKRFLRWKYKDWEKRFDGFKDIKLKNGINQERINADTLPSVEEIEKLVRGCSNIIYKTLFVVGYEIAGRPSEVLSLKWKDVNLDNKKVKVTSTKNHTIRIVPIQNSINYLEMYKDQYPFPNVTQEDYIFPNPKDRYNHLSLSTFHKVLQTLSRNVLGRPISPNFLRHARGKVLHKKLSPKAYQMVMDHSIEVATKYYTRYDEDDVMEEMVKKVFNIKKISPKDTKKYKELEEKFLKLKEDLFKVVQEKVPKKVEIVVNDDNIDEMKEFIKDLKKHEIKQ